MTQRNVISTEVTMFGGTLKKLWHEILPSFIVLPPNGLLVGVPRQHQRTSKKLLGSHRHDPRIIPQRRVVEPHNVSACSYVDLPLAKFVCVSRCDKVTIRGIK